MGIIGYELSTCRRLECIRSPQSWSEWRLTVIAATVRIALVDILDRSEVDIPAGVFLHPAEFRDKTSPKHWTAVYII